ncbi:SulP family inorganic anion transporter [Gordonia hydrophobica]|uniref:SulP family inorganic anion transporter n=1 Tax=Gordonia hydrophobica TaxID=40516 RepID=A0ABZ2U591_9ACTN|nr:SulP family inorganic anion transporter [Gordonia hydrophobica]MBM7369506.1 high affinity sulfate transporter 1 [Gordonia hydrophobica]
MVTDRLRRLTPPALSGYQRSWLRADVLAGASLAAVAIPEAMGYSSIAHVPLSAGLYSLIVPAVIFALVGASRLLVVGADSATAALIASGIAGLGIAGLAPDTAEWLAWAGLIALVTGVLLVIAWVLKLGFLGDFLSTSVLVGFLAGVGILVLTEQVPGMLGEPKESGGDVLAKWLAVVRNLDHVRWQAVVFAACTLLGLVAVKRLRPSLPMPILVVIGSIAAVMVFDLGRWVPTVGDIDAGLPSVRFPPMADVVSAFPTILTISFGCVLVILAQSAATARSFAQRHGDRVDVNRDILGLSTANVSAALTGSFVVNGSPTKTAIVDQQGGRSQVANLTMAGVTLVVVVAVSGPLGRLPEAVLAAIVFVVGVELIDWGGFARIWRIRRIEFGIAVLTTALVVVFGVLIGIIAAMVMSLLQMIHRQYRPERFVVGLSDGGQRRYQSARPGHQTLPGLIVFRYDADLFYANVGRFSDDVTALIKGAPDPVRWLVLDCSAISDVDYSAATALQNLIAFVHSVKARFILAGVTPELRESLETARIMADLAADSVYPSVEAAVQGFREAEND